MEKFTAGYKFGPGHTEIHFVKEGHGNNGDDYQLNFSTDIKTAKVFDDSQAAEQATFDLTESFRLDRDEHHWCAVVADEKGNEITCWESA